MVLQVRIESINIKLASDEDGRVGDESEAYGVFGAMDLDDRRKETKRLALYG